MQGVWMRGSAIMGHKFRSSKSFRLALSSSLSVLASSFSPNFSAVPSSLVGRTSNNNLHQPLTFYSRQARCSMATQSEKTEVGDDPLAEYRDILPIEKGSHNSAKLVIPTLENDTGHFAKDCFLERLEATITACRELGKSSLWVYVPLSRASLMEDMAETGLQFHHASGNIAVLNLWLRNSESKIPEFATHNVGVGAVVINSKNEILCVRELRKNYLPWKTPTGLTELGESLDEAAIREVKEETGIPTTFHSLLSFRQTHGLAHGRSDMFFVCRLDPVETVDDAGKKVIPQPVAQECEIESAAWVPYKEYRDMVMHPEHGHPMMQHVLRVLEARHKIEKTVVGSVVPGRKPNDVYFPAIETEERDLC